MATRPAGTDGSDYAFRQTIEKRYSDIARNRNRACWSSRAQVFLATAELAWLSAPTFLYGVPFSLGLASLAALELLFVGLWYYCSLGKANERMAVVKLTALAVFLCLGQHLVNMYMLHVASDDPSRTLPYLVAGSHQDSHATGNVNVRDALRVVGALLDGAFLLTSLYLYGCLHGYISLKAAMDKGRMATKAKATPGSSLSNDGPGDKLQRGKPQMGGVNRRRA